MKCLERGLRVPLTCSAKFGFSSLLEFSGWLAFSDLVEFSSGFGSLRGGGGMDSSAGGLPFDLRKRRAVVVKDLRNMTMAVLVSDA
jgi:hypothetical protein